MVGSAPKGGVVVARDRRAHDASEWLRGVPIIAHQ